VGCTSITTTLAIWPSPAEPPASGWQESSWPEESSRRHRHRLLSSEASPWWYLRPCVGGTPSPSQQLLVYYQDVLDLSGKLPPTTHGVEHHLLTARVCWLDLAMYAADMERPGLVQRSSSCWASPVHMVKKSNGS
jgi:hypothetical protein